MENEKTQLSSIPRPPVVVIMGHVDHGKSTLLDYIRKTSVVAHEAGGITQNISAYEVRHKDEKGNDRLITFLDTPGHEAFSKMRERGAQAADIAILVVSAEDSVKTQTIEAYNTIIESKTPYIIAINKIDKPNANIEKTKMDLVEKGIYLEGMGGNIPFILISAKEGTGVSELLDTIILVADMEEFTGGKDIPATGIIIEAERDPKRGISAICVIKNGTLKSGMFVASDTAITSTRSMESFLGKPIKEATFSSPIKLIGFESMPEVGNTFTSFNTKKEAENYINKIAEEKRSSVNISKKIKNQENTKMIPIIIKTDVMGSIGAIEKEIGRLNNNDVAFKIINSGVGSINESDIKTASVDKDSIIVGFNVNMENSIRVLSESLKVNIQTFNIIYKLTDWLKEIIVERRPYHEVMEITGTLKVIRVFSATKDKQVIGCKVITGRVASNSIVSIKRRDFEIGKGEIVELQSNKVKAREVLEGTDCGVQVESKIEIAQGDTLDTFMMVTK